MTLLLVERAGEEVIVDRRVVALYDEEVVRADVRSIVERSYSSVDVDILAILAEFERVDGEGGGVGALVGSLDAGVLEDGSGEQTRDDA